MLQMWQRKKEEGGGGVKGGASLVLITGEWGARRRATMDDERLHYRVRGRRNMCYHENSFSDA